jgi:hypothetical protein
MRKLPAPWSAEKTDGGYRVRDKLGRTLCYVYCRDDENNAKVASALVPESQFDRAR